VIQYFSSRLEHLQEKEGSLGVPQIQDFIRQTAIQFPREKLTVNRFIFFLPWTAAGPLPLLEWEG
jgi:hypothetical protein